MGPLKFFWKASQNTRTEQYENKSYLPPRQIYFSSLKVVSHGSLNVQPPDDVTKRPVAAQHPGYFGLIYLCTVEGSRDAWFHLYIHQWNQPKHSLKDDF